jgi:hypothetical protein
MDKAKGAREPGTKRGTTPSPKGSASKTAKQLGITHKQSSKWQKLADVPEAEFEKALAGDKPSTSGIIKSAEPEKVKPMNPAALWLWGHLRAFEREGILERDPEEIRGELFGNQIAAA